MSGPTAETRSPALARQPTAEAGGAGLQALRNRLNSTRPGAGYKVDQASGLTERMLCTTRAKSFARSEAVANRQGLRGAAWVAARAHSLGGAALTTWSRAPSVGAV